jgi:hypothetical protein
MPSLTPDCRAAMGAGKATKKRAKKKASAN